MSDGSAQRTTSATRTYPNDPERPRAPATGIARAEPVVAPGTGHLPTVEGPAEVNRPAQALLERRAQGPPAR